MVEAVPEPSRKAKHSLSHLDKYNGESKIVYLAFKAYLYAKLRIDVAAIGGESKQVWYGFGRLLGKASERMFPWINATETQLKPLCVKDFFEQLDIAFYNAQIP